MADKKIYGFCEDLSMEEFQQRYERLHEDEVIILDLFRIGHMCKLSFKVMTFMAKNDISTRIQLPEWARYSEKNKTYMIQRPIVKDQNILGYIELRMNHALDETSNGNAIFIVKFDDYSSINNRSDCIEFTYYVE